MISVCHMYVCSMFGVFSIRPRVSSAMMRWKPGRKTRELQLFANRTGFGCPVFICFGGFFFSIANRLHRAPESIYIWEKFVDTARVRHRARSRLRRLLGMGVWAVCNMCVLVCDCIERISCMACYGLQIGCEQYKPQFVVVSARICICAHITARAHRKKQQQQCVWYMCSNWWWDRTELNGTTRAHIGCGRRKKAPPINEGAEQHCT